MRTAFNDWRIFVLWNYYIMHNSVYNHTWCHLPQVIISSFWMLQSCWGIDLLACLPQGHSRTIHHTNDEEWWAVLNTADQVIARSHSHCIESVRLDLQKGSSQTSVRMSLCRCMCVCVCVNCSLFLSLSSVVLYFCSRVSCCIVLRNYEKLRS